MTNVQDAGNDRDPLAGADSAALEATIVDQVDLLNDVLADWDHLAVLNRAPYVAPSWCLAWWRHVAPTAAQLRVVLVRDNGALVAVAPLYCTTGPLQPVRYRFLGTETCPRVEPVTQPGMEARAAAQIVSALTRARPRPDVVEFDGVPSSSPWPRLIADHWPGRAVATTTQSVAAPAATLAVDFEQWLNGKSRNFRKQTRRHRRALVERGASFRVAPADECDKALADFERLHQERFRYRGGSGVLDTQVMKMLRESAASLAASGRFRLHLLEHKQRVIGAELVLAAGGEVTSWLGGFDERWAKVQPSIQGLVAAIEHAVADNDTRFDLGPGTQPYKLRLSDHAEQLIWSRIFMPGPRRPLTRIITVPGHVSRAAKQKLFDVVPTAHKHQIKRWLRTLRGGGVRRWALMPEAVLLSVMEIHL